MQHAFRTIAIGLLCLIGFSGISAVADDFTEGERAYKADDYARTVKLLLPLAQRGDPRAQVLVGESYRQANGRKGLDRDLAKARYWFEQAAKQDYTPGLTALGHALVGGPETMRGYKLIRTAAERGDALAQGLLGFYILHRNAYSVPGDDAEGLQWLHKAADQKEYFAAFALALWHRYGDRVEALRWEMIEYRLGGGRLTADWAPGHEPDVRKEMTKAEIAEAWRRATTWLKDHGIDP